METCLCEGKRSQNREAAAALVALLKTCAKQRDLSTGSRIHADILKRGLLEKNVYVGNTLVNLYVKCGALVKAKEVFHELRVWDVVSWNVLIAGYAQHGHGQEALNCFERMQQEGLHPNRVTFTCILKACGSIGAAEKGKEIHVDVVRKGLLEKDVFIGSALVDMYAKCGVVQKAQEVFAELRHRDIVLWNVLIAAYAQHGHIQEALDCFEWMQHEGFFPDSVTIICILKACGSIRSANKGKEIHAKILRSGLLGKNVLVGTALLDMYAKCGVLERAVQSFNELPVRDVISWNALIVGYAQHGHGEEALKYFQQMQCEGLSPDAITFICILKVCGNIGLADKGREIHADIVRGGLFEKNISIGTALVEMYAKCGALKKAQQVFDELQVPDVSSWNALISGYAQYEHGDEALKCFDRMRQKDLSPDAVTFVCILKACGSVGAAEKGQELHSEIRREGFLKRDIFIGTALVDMYAKCGVLDKAQSVFSELQVRDVVSYNALIAGYAQEGFSEQALNCFEQMQCEGLSPSTVTLICILKACGNVGADNVGKEIHAKITREGMLSKNTHVGTALVDMYAKCGLCSKAQEVFEELGVRDVVAWTALISGYALHGNSENALYCFERMQHEGISPNAVTFVFILQACGSIGAADKGKQIHAEIIREGLLEKNILDGTVLVDMYAKCGALEKAQELFDELQARNLDVWTALIAGYAHHGHGEEALNCFERMQCEGLSPDSVTFTLVLNACSHSGLLEKGQMYFHTMSTCYGIIPSLEHYSCMVDLFGRAGQLSKAVAVIKTMPTIDYLPVWNALLGACQKWGNVKLGRLAFEHVLQLETDDAAYVCMSNIYAGAAMQEDAAKIDAMRV